jgi:chlorobactene glucosyltransferase
VSFAVAPILWSLPWVVPPCIALARSARSRSLDEVSADVGTPAPFVSVVIPARNEARNIERCVRSVLSTRYPSIEVIVVDDHSTDNTATIARTIAASDTRLRVIEAPQLPSGWFGKQWACATGAKAARGDLLVFTDADTQHAPDLLPRVINAMHDRRAELLSVAGHQEMRTFWERVIQPQMFALIAIRYGGTEHMSNAKRPEDAIANGQFIAVSRDAYVAVGGHALVRDRVAEDLSMAQEFVRAGRRVAVLLARQQLSTHMYASLREIVRGWRKNIYAGGRHAALGGAFGRWLYPAVLIGVPLIGLIPPIALVLAGLGVLSTAWLTWSSIVVAAALGFWLVIYSFMNAPVRYVVLYPLGLAMLLYIAIGAVARGRRVEWKEREYDSA